MATSKKTVSVNHLRDEANRLLALPLTQAEKKSICSMIEHILMDSDNYKGFQYRYWAAIGCNQWLDLDPNDPTEREKEPFIVGPTFYNDFKKPFGMQHPSTLMFKDENEGEYSRKYY